MVYICTTNIYIMCVCVCVFVNLRSSHSGGFTRKGVTVSVFSNEEGDLQTSMTNESVQVISG